MPVVFVAETVEVVKTMGEISPQWAIIIATFFAGLASLVTAWIGPRRYREELTAMQSKVDQQAIKIDQVINENVALRIDNAQRRGFEQVFLSVIKQQNITITSLWTENQGYRVELGIQITDGEHPPIVAPPIAPVSVDIPSTIVAAATEVKQPRTKRKPKEKPHEPDS